MDVDIAVRVGDLDLDVTFSAGHEVVAVVGPNGAGKTTLVRTIAGLQRPDRATVTIDGRRIDELPPERRGVGVVFQDHRLFPHLSALENVAFGLRARGVHRRAAREQARARLGDVGLDDVADLRPGALSGGQAQRVGLARALAVQPSVLLLDEPLAAVDVAARADLRRMLRAELTRYRGARIVVTHDPVEAATLADRIVVLEAGRITQEGPLAEVTARPRSDWIAKMVGLNLITGAGGSLIAFRPNAVTLHRTRPEGSARNVWHGTAADVHVVADRARVRIDGPVPLVAEVTAAAVADLRLDAGGAVWATVKATDVETYPA